MRYLSTDAGRASRVGKVGWTRAECRQRSGSAQLGQGSREGELDGEWGHRGGEECRCGEETGSGHAIPHNSVGGSDDSPASRIIVFKSAILLNKTEAQSRLTVWCKNRENKKNA